MCIGACNACRYHGRSQVTAVTSVGSMTDDDLYHLVASIEQRSEHPLGKAIVSDYTSHHEAPLTAVEDVTIVPGKGLEATMNGESSTRQYEPCYSRLFARR